MKSSPRRLMKLPPRSSENKEKQKRSKQRRKHGPAYAAILPISNSNFSSVDLTSFAVYFQASTCLIFFLEPMSRFSAIADNAASSRRSRASSTSSLVKSATDLFSCLAKPAKNQAIFFIYFQRPS